MKQGKYRNAIFGFELDVPKGWYVATTDDVGTIKRFVKEGVNDYKIPKNANSTPENISLMLAKDALGSTRNSSLGFSIAKQPSSRITGTMLAQATKPLFVVMNGTTLTKDITNEVIAGRSFASFDLLVESALGKQYVRIYITMINESALTFALTYWSDADRQIMENSIRSIKFFK